MSDLEMSNIADWGIGGFWDFIQFKSKTILSTRYYRLEISISRDPKDKANSALKKSQNPEI